jgi:hypothetical protein
VGGDEGQPPASPVLFLSIFQLSYRRTKASSVPKMNEPALSTSPSSLTLSLAANAQPGLGRIFNLSRAAQSAPLNPKRLARGVAADKYGLQSQNTN